jgi:hypothetical protein
MLFGVLNGEIMERKIQMVGEQAQKFQSAGAVCLAVSEISRKKFYIGVIRKR